VITRNTLLDWVLAETNVGYYLPWTTMTKMRISNEKGIFEYPSSLPSGITRGTRVRIVFLRKSELVLSIELDD
jgi:hypothetical protein